MSLPNISVSGNITSIGDKVRVEPGPKAVTAVATEELLSDDQTAQHYCVGARDALGEIIVLGEPMTYLAWGGKCAAAEVSFYVYQLKAQTYPEGETGPAERWEKVAAYDTANEAMAAGGALAASLS